MKKFIKSPLGIALIPTFVGFILTVIYDVLKGKQVLSTIANILKTIWSGIIDFLNFELKVWWVLVGIVAIVFIFWVIIKIYSVVSEEPEFTKYTSDTIQGWKWEWSWRKNYYGKYEIDNLHPICHSCGTALARKNDYQNSIYCVRCGMEYNGMELPKIDHVELYIGDTVNRKLFPKDKNAS
jgi:hypothetical protein